jgi:3-methyladenine DNA glycosylase AlkC
MGEYGEEERDSWRDKRSRHRRFYSSPHGPGGERTLPTSRRRSQQVARVRYRTLEFLRPSRERIETKEFHMRKSIKNSDTELSPEKPSWLDVSTIAKVEVTSEDAQLPIEGAFAEGDKRGWRASERGKQTIRLIFDEPQRIRRIWLRFIELHEERTQQFTLQWSKDKNDALRPLFQQQWNFSPSGSTSQIEDYEVELDDVWMLQLVIDPDISRGPAVATLASWRLA